MKKDNSFRESFVSTLKEIFNKYQDKWQATSSQDCFRGVIRKEYTINENEIADLYKSVFEIYNKIRKQVEINKVNSINNSLRTDSMRQSTFHDLRRPWKKFKLF